MPSGLRLPRIGQLFGRFRRFFTWWLRELEAASVDLGALVGVHGRRRVALKPFEAGFLVTVWRGGAVEKEYSWSEESGGSLLTPRSVLLEVPDRYLLVRTLTLPAGAQRRLTSAVALKLLRESPLPVDQLIWAIGPVERAATPGLITVPVALLRRTLLENWRGVIKKSGASVAHVVTEGGWSLDAMPPNGGSGRAFITRHANGLLTATLVTGLVCIGILWQQRMQREEAWLEGSMRQVKAAAADDVVLRTRLMREAAVARDFDSQSKAPDILHFLETVNERIPKGMWIQSLGAKDAGVHVTVLAPSHADIAKLFGGLPEVEKVTESARVPVSADEERVEVLFQLRESDGP